MTVEGLVGITLLVVFVILILLFAGLRDRWPVVLRPIESFRLLGQRIERAVEAGQRVHLSLGTGSVIGSDSAPALAGLAVLGKVARETSMSDRPVVVTAGDGAMTLLAQDTLRAAYNEAGAKDRYRATSGRLLAPTPFSYIAGLPVLLASEDVSVHMLIGSFGAEGALGADFGERNRIFVLAGTDDVQSQALLFATADHPLIGEEVFASGAYLNVGHLHRSSIRAQDVVRLLVVVAILIGTLLRTLGVGL